MPKSHSPSRRAAGHRHRACPSRSAPRRRHRPSPGGARSGASPVVGSRSGSQRRRSSIGSIFMSCASSSIALSSAKVPTNSPGARIQVLASMSMSATFCSSRKRPGGIEMPGREGELLRAVVVRRHGDDAGMDQRVEPAVAAGTQRHALHRRSCGRRPGDRRPRGSAPAAPAGRPASTRRRPGSGGSTGPCRRSRRRRTATARAPGRPSGRTPWRASPRCCVIICVASCTMSLPSIPIDGRGMQLDRVVVQERRR